MPDPVKTLWYIKYYILNSNGRLEHSSYSISSNCQKICSRTGSEGKISENEFSNATYGLNTVLTTKQSKNDLLKKRWLEIHSLISEAVVRSCTVKNVFLKISQNSQDNTWHRCFPVNFAKFLRRPFLQNTSCGCFCYFKEVLILSGYFTFSVLFTTSFIICLQGLMHKETLPLIYILHYILWVFAIWCIT